jgi:hypothetical protein
MRPGSVLQGARVARQREGRAVRRRRVSGRRQRYRSVPAVGWENYNVRVRKP